MHKVVVYIFTIVFTGIVCSVPYRYAQAESPADLVNKGNADYLAGRYDEAISAYDEASVNAPESPILYFNKGTALYQKGDYAAACEAFEKAALKSKDVRLEAESKFNLGNCAFRQADRLKDSDLKGALQKLEESVQHYQEALKAAPDFKEAAENIEVARLVMKNILDEINKKKQEAQEEQQIQNRIKELIQKQKQALDRNQTLQGERKQKGDSEELQKKVRDLAEEQKSIQSQTEEVAKGVAKAGSQNPNSKEDPTETHLKNAATEQKAAAGNLQQYHTKEAEANQERAVKELEKALDSRARNQKGADQQQGRQQEKGQNQQPQSDQQGEPQGAKEPPQCEATPSEQDKNQGQNQLEGARVSEDARDILDEEKENQDARRLQVPGGYRGVDKDW